MEQAYNFLITRLYATILVIVQNFKDLLVRQKEKSGISWYVRGIFQPRTYHKYIYFVPMQSKSLFHYKGCTASSYIHLR